MTSKFDVAADRARLWQETGDPYGLVLVLRDLPEIPITPAARRIIAECLLNPPKRPRGRQRFGREAARSFLRRIAEAVAIQAAAAAIRKEEPGIPADRLIADIAEEHGIPESRVSAALYPRKRKRAVKVNK